MLTILDLLGPDIFTSQDVLPAAVVFNILSVFLLSLIILFTYKKSYQTTVYNKSFAISLPISAMVTSVIIISVSSNIILSLGMVGALSIVRFRTALKNPFDTVFMFWAIGLGVTSGAGLILVALLSTIVISAAIFILIALELLESSYFLIIRASSPEDEDEIMKKVQTIYGKYTLRNKTIKDTGLDITLEIRGKDKKYSEINRIKDIKSVKSVVLLSHQGDYISE